MFLTFVWGGLPGQRPLFVLTGDQPDARGVGRTRCIRLLAELLGGVVEVSAADPGTIRNLETRLACPPSPERRIVCIDGFPGVLLPQALARWLDAEWFEWQTDAGLSSRRPNLVTWCVTARSNEDITGRCLVDRAVVIRLAAPNQDARPNWQSEVRAMIRERCDHILADAVSILAGQRYPISVSRTRFSAWCDGVLATDSRVNDLLKRLGGCEEDRPPSESAPSR